MVETVPARFKKLYLEITNICNLQCSFCPEVERPKHSLGLADLESQFKKIKGWSERVCLHVMGEPLNHPEFPDFVRLAGEMDISLEITTNGILLNSKTQEALLNPAVVQVNFSLQSFFDNFPGKSPDIYLQRILSLAQTARTRRPDLYVNFRLWNLGSDSDRRVADVVLEKIRTEFGVEINPNVDPGFNKSKKITDRIYLHYDSRFRWPNPNDEDLGSAGRCHGTVSHLAVHANGDVVPCCLDKEARLKLGNLRDQNLDEIMQSEIFVRMNKGFQEGRLTEELCRRCDYIRRFN